MHTIISYINWRLGENVTKKPGIVPSFYIIEAAPELGKFSLTYIDNGKHTYVPPLSETPMTISILSEEIANAVVNDYVLSCIARGEGAQPGIFAIEGKWSEKGLHDEHQDLLDKYDMLHRGWLVNLIRMADEDFIKSGRSARAISDMQRIAARILNQDREWNLSVETLSSSCPFCKASVHPDAIKCATCGETIKQDALIALRKSIEEGSFTFTR